MTSVDASRTLLISTVGRKTSAGKARLPRGSLVVGMLVAAAAVRTGWTILAAPPPESDFLTFLSVAQLIGHGQWWANSYGWSWQGPGYPLLLAPFTLLGPASLPAIYAVNLVLGVVTVGLVYRLGRSLFGPRAGLIAGYLAAALPGLWLWTPIVSAENLSVPIVLAISVLAVDRRWPAIAGGLAGFLVFVRPSMLLFLVVAAVSVVALAPSETKRRSTAMFIAGAALAIAPIVLLNLRAGGPALPVGASGWQPWLVYNERSTGAWFPAQDRDDYPFRGMENDDALAATLRSAQQKLAIEFLVLNPGDVIPGIVNRHVYNWRSDTAGVDWTVGRPTASSAEAQWSEPLRAFVDSIYIAVLALATVAATRFRANLRVLFSLVLPIAYVVAPAAIAEGNARYHVNALGALVVLAASALAVGSARVRLLGLTAAGLAAAVPIAAAPVLVVAIVAVPAGALVVRGVRALPTVRLWPAHRRRLALVIGGATIIGSEVAVTAALVLARQAAIDWSLTQPSGWQVYVPNGPPPLTSEAELTMRPSDVSARFRKVSYPDAVVLRTPPAHLGGVGIRRLFPDLQIGQLYVLYLQLAGSELGSGAGRVVVRLNGEMVWQSVDQPATSTWHDIVVRWTADTPYASIDLESAGDHVDGSELMVRSVHLYPKY